MRIGKRCGRGQAALALALAMMAWLQGAAHAQQMPNLQSGAATGWCSSPLGALLPECQQRSKEGGRGAAIAPSPPSSLRPEPERAGAAAQRPPVRESTERPADRTPENPPERPAEDALDPAADGASEFQRYASAVLGGKIERFGAALFARTPSTFAPVDRVPVPANYVIGPGDEILLRVWGQVDLDAALTVDRTGAIFVPQAGELRVAGLEAQHLRSFLQEHLGRVYRNFDLTATLGQLRPVPIYVTGAARRPGSYTVGALSTLVSAIFASGGPSAAGSMRRVELRRGGAVAAQFDLYDLLVRGDKSGDAPLEPGDVIHYPPVGRQAAIGGSVERPGLYELKEGETLEDLLRHAGGPTPLADLSRVVIERAGPDGVRRLARVSLTAGAATAELRAGDVIRLLPVSPRTKDVVTLRGNVASPGRYPWFPGMRLRDLIPSREFLLTREYWLHRDGLGRLKPEQLEPFGDGAPEEKRPNGLRLDVPEINWEYALIERRDRERQGPRLIPFRPGRLLLDGDEAENHELEPDDVVTVFSQRDFPVALEQRTRLVRVEGEVKRAGWYAIGPEETLGQVLERAGGLTAHAYPEGLVLTRASAAREQQQRIDLLRAKLGAESEMEAQLRPALALPAELQEAERNLERQRRIISGLGALRASGRVVLPILGHPGGLSAFSGVRLEEGDEIHIPARPGVVHVFGEVNNNGTLLHRDGMAVKDAMRMAGGLTRYADRKKAFVIRCDGTVVDRRNPGGRFDDLRLYPGDAVVVPPKLARPAKLRELRDVSQVLAQLALGAAAINVLR